MAKNSISDYDTTAANNTDIQSTDISEGCPASGINNAIREMMADTADAFTQGTPIALDQTNNRVGIGTTSPADKLHVSNGSSGRSSFASNTDLIIEDNGNAALQFASPNTNVNAIYFSDPESNTAGVLQYSHSTNAMSFDTADATRMTINSSGKVGIGTTTINDQLVVDSSSAEEGITVRGGGFDALKIGLVNPGTSNDGVIGMKISNALRFITNDTERMRIDNGGNLLLGTTSDISAGQRLAVKYSYTNPGAAWESDNVNVHNAIVFKNPNGTVGTIRTAASGVQYNTSSDHRLKENVADMTGAIARVKQLAPKRFNFIADADTTVDGFLAHEAQAVVPEAVSGNHNEVDDDGNAVMQGIDQSKLVPLLTGALREAIAKIETLETEMTALKARVTALEA